MLGSVVLRYYAACTVHNVKRVIRSPQSIELFADNIKDCPSAAPIDKYSLLKLVAEAYGKETEYTRTLL